MGFNGKLYINIKYNYFNASKQRLNCMCIFFLLFFDINSRKWIAPYIYDLLKLFKLSVIKPSSKLFKYLNNKVIVNSVKCFARMSRAAQKDDWDQGTVNHVYVSICSSLVLLFQYAKYIWNLNELSHLNLGRVKNGWTHIAI